LSPNVGTLEPGNVLSGIRIGDAGRISAFGPPTGLSACSTGSEGQLIHARGQQLDGFEWRRTGAAAAATAISCRTAATTAAAAAHLNGVVAFNQKGRRRVLRAGRGRLLRRNYRQKTLLIHLIRSRIVDGEYAPRPIVIRAIALGKRTLRNSGSIANCGVPVTRRHLPASPQGEQHRCGHRIHCKTLSRFHRNTFLSNSSYTISFDTRPIGTSSSTCIAFPGSKRFSDKGMLSRVFIRQSCPGRDNLRTQFELSASLRTGLFGRAHKARILFRVEFQSTNASQTF
jgi:hypothetical protein